MMGFVKHKSSPGDEHDLLSLVLCCNAVLHLLPYCTSLQKLITVKIKLYRVCPAAF